LSDGWDDIGEAPAESPAEQGGRRWRAVAAALQEGLRQGEFAPGARLPAELALAGRFAVSRFTIRRALAELEKDGLLRIERGRGIFAADDLLPYRIGERTRLSETLRGAAVAPGRRVVARAVAPADPAPARALGVAPGSDLEIVDSAGEADGRLISLGRTRLAHDRFGGIGETVARCQSWTAALAEFGVADDLRKSTEVIGRPACFGITTLAAHRVKLVIEDP
jgi:GntR family phosphonate transport system transcriptional regulator